MWKTLQDKIEIRINLEETWKKQRQKEVNNRKETGKRLMTFYRRQDGSVDFVRQEANYILQKTIRMRKEAWNLLDEGSRLYALIHEARIRRELIL